MIGKIISWDNRKNFGFIKGENGETYFLHNSEIKDKESMSKFRSQTKLNFDFKATKRGLRAIDVEFVSNPKSKFNQSNKKTKSPKMMKDVLNDSFVIRKKGTPRGKIAFSGKIKSDWSRSIEDTKLELSELAKSLGFNCIYDIEMVMEKRYSGNYIYKEFAFNATAGVLLQKETCKDETEKKLADEYIQQQIDIVKEKHDKELEKDAKMNSGGSYSTGSSNSESSGSRLPGAYGVIADIFRLF